MLAMLREKLIQLHEQQNSFPKVVSASESQYL